MKLLEVELTGDDPITADWLTRLDEDFPSQAMEAALRAIEAALSLSAVALAPFAREADEYDLPTRDSLTGMADGWEDDDDLADVPVHIKVGDLRRAAALLSSLTPAVDPEGLG